MREPLTGAMAPGTHQSVRTPLVPGAIPISFGDLRAAPDSLSRHLVRLTESSCQAPCQVNAFLGIISGWSLQRGDSPKNRYRVVGHPLHTNGELHICVSLRRAYVPYILHIFLRRFKSLFDFSNCFH